MENFDASQRWIDQQPRRDLFPIPLEGVLARTPIMRSPSFLIFLLALAFEQGRRRMRKPIGGNLFLAALLHRKPERSGSESALGGGGDGVLPERFLQLLEL